MSERQDRAVENMWVSHKDYLRRMLIGITRDVDLTDDY